MRFLGGEEEELVCAGCVRARWECFGSFWACLGTFWERLEASGHAWECFGELESVWKRLSVF